MAIRTATTVSEECPRCGSDNVSPARGAKTLLPSPTIPVNWRRVYSCADCKVAGRMHTFAIRVQIELIEERSQAG